MKQEEWEYSSSSGGVTVGENSYVVGENEGWLFNESLINRFEYAAAGGKLSAGGGFSAGESSEYLCGDEYQYSLCGGASESGIRRSSTFGTRRCSSELSAKRRKQSSYTSSPSWSRRNCKGPVSSFSSSLSRFTLPDENGKRKIRHDIMSIAESLPSLPGLYFDKRQKGFRVRYQNVYVGWVALSRFPSIEEAYISARDIWENAKLHAEKYQTPHAAIMASLPLQQEAQASGKNRGGRPRTVTQLPPNPTDWLNNAILAPSPPNWSTQPNDYSESLLDPFVSNSQSAAARLSDSNNSNIPDCLEDTTNYWTHHTSIAAMLQQTTIKQQLEPDSIYRLAGTFTSDLDYGLELSKTLKPYYPIATTSDDHLGLITVGPGAISYSQPVDDYHEKDPLTPESHHNQLHLDSTALPSTPA